MKLDGHYFTNTRLTFNILGIINENFESNFQFGFNYQ